MKKTAAKGNQMLGVLRRNLKNCPRNLKDLAYKSILRPKLEYASSVWDPYTAELRTSTNLRGYKDAQLDLFVTMNYCWPPPQQRRAESRLALFHCIVNGTVDIDSAVLIQGVLPERRIKYSI